MPKLVLQPITGTITVTSVPTGHNISREAGTWRNCQAIWPWQGHNPVAHHPASGRRQQTQWRPGTLCSLPARNT